MVYFAKPLLWVSVALVVGTIMGSIVSSQLAAHGGSVSSSVIHACVNNSSGVLRIVDATDTCNNNESPLDWNSPDISGNATTASALANDPLDCSSGQFAHTISASGDLTCSGVGFSDLTGTATDGQIPNDITVDLASTATALAANGSNCSVGQFAQGVDASGNAEGCAAVATGIAGYDRVLGSFGTSTDGFTPTLNAACSSGKKILGGGVEYEFVSGGRPYVNESYPSSETQWTAHVEKLVDGTPDFRARAIAICGNAS